MSHIEELIRAELLRQWGLEQDMGGELFVMDDVQPGKLRVDGVLDVTALAEAIKAGL